MARRLRGTVWHSYRACMPWNGTDCPRGGYRQPAAMSIEVRGSFLNGTLPTKPSNLSSMRQIPLAAHVYIALVVLLGLSSLSASLWFWRCENVSRFILYMAVSLLSSGFKVPLPGVQATISVNYLVILAGFIQLTLPETLMLGLASSFVQSLWHAKAQPRLIQLLFNVTSIPIAITGGYWIYHLDTVRLVGIQMYPALRLGTAACVYYLLNTVSVALVVALTEQRSALRIWKEAYLWSLPYYMLGASITSALMFNMKQLSWTALLLVTPVVYVIYQSFRLYLGRIESEASYARETASLHLRTIEALALAIEAKDDTTHDHLRRVQVYATEIGKELGLTNRELQAVEAASVLHDIGKLAVPDYIISKPGRLTPAEFEKMKVHPIVGAEILERVQFPYPVAPIVRSHHEKWDGSGYPDGLAGETIPVGARIIAAVDCLDALASDRQYRPALPLQEALNVVVTEAGRSFDPKIIEIIARRAAELERKARADSAGQEPLKLSKDLKIHRGLAPAAGFEETNGRAGERPSALADAGASHLPACIAAARHEIQIIQDVVQNLGSPLSIFEKLSLLCARLKRLVPHDCVAIYVLEGDRLKPCCVQGENSRLFSSLGIPLGQGLSGWVLENDKPVINGNPAVEPGYLKEPAKFTTLRSALAVPLTMAAGKKGVLALYSLEKDFFSRDQLGVLIAITANLARVVEIARHEPHASASVDSFASVPDGPPSPMAAIRSR